MWPPLLLPWSSGEFTIALKGAEENKPYNDNLPFILYLFQAEGKLSIFHPISMGCREHPNMPNVLQDSACFDALLLTLLLCFVPPHKHTSDTLPENTSSDVWSCALLVPYANPPAKFTSLCPTNSPIVQDSQSFPVPWISIQRCPVYISGLR